MFVWGGFILYGKHFIVLWVGEIYIDAYLIACIIMSAYILPLVQNFANSLIEATGRFKFKAKLYFITISIGIILGGLLSPYYGYWAIAWCYSAFWILSQVIMNWYFDTKLDLDIIRFFKNTFGKLFFFLVIAILIGYLADIAIENNTWIDFIIKTVIYSSAYR